MNLENKDKENVVVKTAFNNFIFIDFDIVYRMYSTKNLEIVQDVHNDVAAKIWRSLEVNIL
jgi:hypothetical protein